MIVDGDRAISSPSPNMRFFFSSADLLLQPVNQTTEQNGVYGAFATALLHMEYPVDQRQLLLPVDADYSCRSWGETIWYRRYRIGHRSAGSATEAEANGRQGTTSGGGGIWYERADGADVAARQAAVGEEGQAEVANPTGPVRRGVGRGGRAPSAERREGALRATTILEWLDERHPGRFSLSQLRRCSVVFVTGER